jgi:hypothetical protein
MPWLEKPDGVSVDNGSLGSQSLDENDNARDDGSPNQTPPPCTPGTPGCSTDGGRRRGSRKSNPWLAHVKETMKKNRGVSFKNVLKLAKKSFKNSKYGSKSKSKSKSKTKYGGKGRQRGGSGMAGKAPFGENAAPVV